MKIIVLSDTHGKLKKVYDIVNKITEPDMIIHCGDYEQDAQLLENELGVPIIFVPGNCDGGGRDDFEIVETSAGNIFVTHGHEFGAGYSEERLMYAALENNCKAVCYGHTHLPVCQWVEDILFVNPGSLSKPRDGSNGSYAVISVEGDKMYGNIVYYDTICSLAEKKSTGGYIRNMLNYSDRF